jgi:hypothetical protein
MRVKSGATVDGMHWMLWYAAAVADVAHQQYTGQEATITSGTDMAMGRVTATLHARGGAFDLRAWALVGAARVRFLQALRVHLGPAFDVIDEDDHIHVELSAQGVRMVQV